MGGSRGCSGTRAPRGARGTDPCWDQPQGRGAPALRVSVPLVPAPCAAHRGLPSAPYRQHLARAAGCHRPPSSGCWSLLRGSHGSWKDPQPPVAGRQLGSRAQRHPARGPLSGQPRPATHTVDLTAAQSCVWTCSQGLLSLRLGWQHLSLRALPRCEVAAFPVKAVVSSFSRGPGGGRGGGDLVALCAPRPAVHQQLPRPCCGCLLPRTAESTQGQPRPRGSHLPPQPPLTASGCAGPHPLTSRPRAGRCLGP